MPTLTKVLTTEDLKTGRGQSRMDLTAYTDIIESVRSDKGVGGYVELDDEESKRTEKRRLSIAAKQMGLKLTWRKADDTALRFVLSERDQPAPDGRKRKKQS